jgi:hypothetical protein
MQRSELFIKKKQMMMDESIRKKELEVHCGFTGKPQILQPYPKLNRSIQDLYNWSS